MKNLILIAVLGSCLTGYAQLKKFEITDTYSFPIQYVFLDVEGSSSGDLYRKTIEWIESTLGNPDEVIQVKVEDRYLQISDIEEKVFVLKDGGLPYFNAIKYDIVLNFENERVKFEVTNLQQYINPSAFRTGGWEKLVLTPNHLYKKDGKANKAFQTGTLAVLSHFNSLCDSKLAYLKRR